MKLYMISLGSGLLAGLLYGCLGVRSPAPPVVALVGLFGILLGEQIPPLVKHAFAAEKRVSWVHDQVKPHMFGELPRCKDVGGPLHG